MRQNPLEFISRFKPQNALFGIANVQSTSRGCKITVGYFLNDNSVTIVAPKTCHYCPKTSHCTRAFAEQILTKYNEKHGNSEVYFLL
jgi:hypothetical protein